MAHRPIIITGAQVLVYINGRLFGRCTGFGWTSATPRRKIRVVDLLHPVELAVTTVDVVWDMSVLRTLGDGGMQGAGVVAPQSVLSREKYFTLQLVDRKSGFTLFACALCETEGETWRVRPKNIVEGQVFGSGILWTNEGM